jgi:hypothetical protein
LPMSAYLSAEPWCVWQPCPVMLGEEAAAALVKAPEVRRCAACVSTGKMRLYRYTRRIECVSTETVRVCIDTQGV